MMIFITPKDFTDVIKMVESGYISRQSGKIVIFEIWKQNYERYINERSGSLSHQ